MRMVLPPLLGLLALLVLAWGTPAQGREFIMPPGDTLDFVPYQDPSDSAEIAAIAVESETGSEEWLRTPIGDRLLMDVEEWSLRGHGTSNVALAMSYNRVDPFRFGLAFQAMRPWTMRPRVGARLEYATGRERGLYGLQVEQPILPRQRLAIGAQVGRVTDHSELQQVEDVENSLALLFGRQDYRDYFEREGGGVYLASRVAHLTTLSLHARRDEYRSLPTRFNTRSWFQRHRALRVNPAIDEGEARRVILRLERLAYRTGRTRTGLYHWVELEKAGGGLKGDFEYVRLLADARSVLRLSPAMTLALRAVVGSTLDGELPAQRGFTVGGVDGLRAHRFAQFRGDQAALAQAEYTVGLWPVRAAVFDGGVHAMAFVDAGRAWSNPDHDWDLAGQHVAVDGGLGLGTAEDNLRVYFAWNLQDLDADVVISVRLRRPF